MWDKLTHSHMSEALEFRQSNIVDSGDHCSSEGEDSSGQKKLGRVKDTRRNRSTGNKKARLRSRTPLTKSRERTFADLLLHLNDALRDNLGPLLYRTALLQILLDLIPHRKLFVRVLLYSPVPGSIPCSHLPLIRTCVRGCTRSRCG